MKYNTNSIIMNPRKLQIVLKIIMDKISTQQLIICLALAAHLLSSEAHAVGVIYLVT